MYAHEEHDSSLAEREVSKYIKKGEIFMKKKMTMVMSLTLVLVLAASMLSAAGSSGAA